MKKFHSSLLSRRNAFLRTESNYVESQTEIDENVFPVKQDNLISVIFAPDPVTGVPRSDLALIMSHDCAPEVSQYIRDNLLRPNPSVSRAEDADTALEFVKSASESFERYANRLKEIVAKSFKDEQTSDNS